MRIGVKFHAEHDLIIKFNYYYYAQNYYSGPGLYPSTCIIIIGINIIMYVHAFLAS